MNWWTLLYNTSAPAPKKQKQKQKNSNKLYLAREGSSVSYENFSF